MAQKITLREASELLAEQGYEIAWRDNLTIEDFFSYFDHHYKSLLQQKMEDWSHEDGAIHFLAEDMLGIFA